MNEDIIKEINETIKISDIINETLDHQGNKIKFCNKLQKKINNNQNESKIILRQMNSYFWVFYYKIIEVGSNMINYTTKNYNDVKDIDKLIKNKNNENKETYDYDSENIIRKLNILYNNSINMSYELDNHLFLLEEQNEETNKNESIIVYNNKKINKIIKK